MDKQFRSNMFWNAFGNAVYLFCQWAVTVAVTRIAGLEAAGILSLAMSVSSVFQTIALFGIRNYQISDISGRYSDSCYVTARLMTCGAAMGMCMLFSLINLYSAEKMLAIMLFMVYRLAENFSDVLHGVLQKNNRLDIAGKAFFIKGIITPAAFFGGYYLLGSLCGGLLVMAAGSVCTTLIYDLTRTERLSQINLNSGRKKCIDLLKDTSPLCLYLLLLSAVTNAPKYILEKMSDEDSLGAYSSIFAPALLVLAVTNYIYAPFVPRLAEHYKNKDIKSFRWLTARICLAILAFAAVTAAASVFLGEWGLTLLFGEKIRPYVYLLGPIIACVFLSSYLAVVCTLGSVIRDFRGMIAGCGTGLAVSAAAVPLCIRYFGINGTSFGQIISLIAAILTALAFLSARIRKDMSQSE